MSDLSESGRRVRLARPDTVALNSPIIESRSPRAMREHLSGTIAPTIIWLIIKTSLRPACTFMN